MSDYFAALAARTIQPERGVQPRPRVSFEDARNVAPVAHEGSPDPVSIARTRAHAASPAGDGEHSRPSRTSAQRAKAAGDELREEVASADGEPRTRTLDRPLQADTDGRQQPDDERHAVRIHEAVAIETSSGPAVEPRHASSERTTRAPEAIVPRSIAPLSTRVRAQSSPRAASPSDDGGTVRIHIGRVDVRAVMPATAPQAPAREARRGLITLDEYVQQRGGTS